MEGMLEEVEHGPQLGLGEMAVYLGDTDQDIDQEKDKAIMTFGLGLRIGCGPALDIACKAEKGRKQGQSPEQSGVDQNGKETSHSLPATGGQQDEDDNKKTTAAARLVAVIAVLALHGERREKVAGIGRKDQGA
jgi:hypothetical protein